MWRGPVRTAALVFIAICDSRFGPSDQKLQDRHFLLAVHEQHLLVGDLYRTVLPAQSVD
jgi:hypothetical protein